ncbi:hypothetical protein QZH41_008881 [Actinostola sp. cb2023]|nr:hypothetical protein QZH41_008881 [Actinostola sp. cb2023]
MFGLKPPKGYCNYPAYVKQWREAMRAAYDLANTQASKSAMIGKQQYDKKVRHTALQEGDRVLVRNLSERGGTGKLRSYWEDFIHIIKSQRGDLPHYEVIREDGEGRTRVLHRNLLLPCSYLPVGDESVQRTNNKQNDRSIRNRRQTGRQKPKTLPLGRGQNSRRLDSDSEEELTGFAPRDLRGLQWTSQQETSQTTPPSEPDDPPLATVDSEVQSDVSDVQDSTDDEVPPRRSGRTRQPRQIFTYENLGDPTQVSYQANSIETQTGRVTGQPGSPYQGTPMFGPFAATQGYGYPTAATQGCGYPPTTTQSYGYPPTTTQSCGYPPTTTQSYGYPPTTTQSYGYPPTTTQSYGYPTAATQSYGYPPTTTQSYGYPTAATQSYGYPPTTTQSYGYPPTTTQSYGYPPWYFHIPQP